MNYGPPQEGMEGVINMIFGRGSTCGDILVEKKAHAYHVFIVGISKH